MDPASNQSAKYFISKGIDQFFGGVHDISRFILQSLDDTNGAIDGIIKIDGS